MRLYIGVNIVYICCCAYFSFLSNNSNLTKKNIRLILTGLILVSACIAAGRPLIAPDTPQYLEAYLNSYDVTSKWTGYGLFDFFFNRTNYSMEAAFFYMMSRFRILSESPRLFFGFNALVSAALTMQGCTLCLRYLLKDKYSESELQEKVNNQLLTMWFTFMALFGTLYTTVAMRAALALGFGTCFIGLMLNRKNIILAILSLAFAIMFHSTGITYIFIYLIIQVAPKKINRKTIMAFGIAGAGLYVFGIARLLSEKLGMGIRSLMLAVGIQSFGSYFDTLVSQFKFREICFIVLLSGALFFCYTCEDKMSQYAFLTMISIAIYVFVNGIEAISREADFFAFFLIPIVGYASLNNDKDERFYVLLGKICIMAMILPQYIMVFIYGMTPRV